MTRHTKIRASEWLPLWIRKGLRDSFPWREFDCTAFESWPLTKVFSVFPSMLLWFTRSLREYFPGVRSKYMATGAQVSLDPAPSWYERHVNKPLASNGLEQVQTTNLQPTFACINFYPPNQRRSNGFLIGGLRLGLIKIKLIKITWLRLIYNANQLVSTSYGQC